MSEYQKEAQFKTSSDIMFVTDLVKCLMKFLNYDRHSYLVSVNSGGFFFFAFSVIVYIQGDFLTS